MSARECGAVLRERLRISVIAPTTWRGGFGFRKPIPLRSWSPTYRTISISKWCEELKTTRRQQTIPSLLAIRESWEEERNYLDSFHRRRVDGIVRIPAIDAPGGKAKSVLGNLPVVYADRYPLVRDSYVGRVGVDNRRAADSATRYLLSLGHRQIGIIAGDATSGTSVDRLEGFMQALRSAKIRPDRSMIHRGHNDMESGHFHAMQLLTRVQRPTAIFCTNNTMALGALAAIQEIGLGCPEDISLLGFDDFYWATLLRPRLTVVRQPAREVGMIAARMLIDHIEGRPSIPTPALLATQLIVRDSCCPPKKTRSR